MQSFQLQEAWQRTISEEDKERLFLLFEESKDHSAEAITCVPYRLAVNHRQELLCTVLIHNRSEESLDIRNVDISVYKNNLEIAHHSFHDLPLQLPSKTSMPWTYIFPLDRYHSSLTNEDKKSIIVSLSEHLR